MATNAGNANPPGIARLNLNLNKNVTPEDKGAKGDGTTDAKRPVVYMGEAQIMTGAGPLPINFEIEAKTLTEAVDQFGPAAKEAIERTVRELQELRRQAASSRILAIALP